LLHSYYSINYERVLVLSHSVNSLRL